MDCCKQTVMQMQFTNQQRDRDNHKSLTTYSWKPTITDNHSTLAKHPAVYLWKVWLLSAINS